MCDFLYRLKAPDSGVEIEHVLADGDSCVEILRVAQENGCDLIVMSTHGGQGWGAC